MRFVQDEAYHLYNRGNNRNQVYYNHNNYLFFIEKIKKHIKPYCEILAWCLMPNHFHLVMYATEKSCLERNVSGARPVQELSFQIGKMLSSYSQAINKQNHSTGSIFQQKTKSKALLSEQNDGSYLRTAIHYCHQNPWKARLVERLEDWPYCSFGEYLGMSSNNICNKKLLIDLTGYSLATFYEDSYGQIEDFEF